MLIENCVDYRRLHRRNQDLIRKAIELHLKGMREEGDPIPEPRTVCDNVEVA
jgi:hypothetical protein